MTATIRATPDGRHEHARCRAPTRRARTRNDRRVGVEVTEVARDSDAVSVTLSDGRVIRTNYLDYLDESCRDRRRA
jgi:hypothetical protein